MNFDKKHVLVWGKGKSGLASKALLEENGAIVTIIELCDEASFNFSLKFDYVVLSPGVKVLHNNNLSLLQQNGAELLSEPELAFLFTKSKILGITGTNGKTTTTTLLHQICVAANLNSYLCGNVGTPFSAVAKQTGNTSCICLELSSYQLETVRDFHAHVACMLNIAPDHLTRHLSMQNYIKAKANIFQNQTTSDFAVLNADDQIVASMDKYTKAQVVWFSLKNECSGAYVKNNIIYYFDSQIMPINQIKLLGNKNIENVLAAVAIAKTQGIPNEAINKAVSQFLPIEHRLQTVGTANEVLFINDSKATNVSSTITALQAIEQPKVLLLGGSDKGEDFSTITPFLDATVRYVIAYGATKQKWLLALNETLNKYRLFEAPDMQKAFALATQLAMPNDVVLLSPACASFDEFNNFEHRGQVFCQLVKEYGAK